MFAYVRAVSVLIAVGKTPAVSSGRCEIDRTCSCVNRLSAAGIVPEKLFLPSERYLCAGVIPTASISEREHQADKGHVHVYSRTATRVRTSASSGSQ